MTEQIVCYRCGAPQIDRFDGHWQHERPWWEYMGEDWVCMSCIRLERFVNSLRKAAWGVL